MDWELENCMDHGNMGRHGNCIGTGYQWHRDDEKGIGRYHCHDRLHDLRYAGWLAMALVDLLYICDIGIARAKHRTKKFVIDAMCIIGQWNSKIRDSKNVDCIVKSTNPLHHLDI